MLGWQKDNRFNKNRKRNTLFSNSDISDKNLVKAPCQVCEVLMCDGTISAHAEKTVRSCGMWRNCRKHLCTRRENPSKRRLGAQQEKHLCTRRENHPQILCRRRDGETSLHTQRKHSLKKFLHPKSGNTSVKHRENKPQ